MSYADELVPLWPLPELPELRDDLLAAYGAPERGYHDARHLLEVLHRLAELAAHEEFDARSTALAAWFHDAVYDGERDAEERSALWARTALEEVEPPGLAQEVARLVRLTADHQPGPDDTAGAVLCDADLAVLASSEQRYAEYVAGVRVEFAHLDEETFAAGRARVLESLAAGPLFHTAHGRRTWEQTARANLARELAQRGRP